MKKVETLRQLQLINKYIYNDLRKYCNENGIQIYLHGGTLIGALRHKGFIPWDDDIDVCMSRPDYEYIVMHSHGKISDKCMLIDPKTEDNFRGYIPVIVYNNSKMESGQYREKENLKIGISVFVYDGVPQNVLVQKLYFLHMYILRAQHALCRADFKHVNTPIAKAVGPFLQCFYKSKDIIKYKHKILKLQERYKYQTCQYVATNADYRSSREVCLKDDFERAVPVMFEGIKSYTYSHYDKHLKKYYGDYMQLPPQEEQVPKHSFLAYIDEGFDYSE